MEKLNGVFALLLLVSAFFASCEKEEIGVPNIAEWSTDRFFPIEEGEEFYVYHGRGLGSLGNRIDTVGFKVTHGGRNAETGELELRFQVTGGDSTMPERHKIYIQDRPDSQVEDCITLGFPSLRFINKSVYLQVEEGGYVKLRCELLREGEHTRYSYVRLLVE